MKGYACEIHGTVGAFVLVGGAEIGRIGEAAVGDGAELGGAEFDLVGDGGPWWHAWDHKKVREGSQQTGRRNQPTFTTAARRYGDWIR